MQPASFLASFCVMSLLICCSNQYEDEDLQGDSNASERR
jgi:hypothetical protein